MKNVLILICCLLFCAGVSQTTDSVVVTRDSTLVKKLKKDHKPRNAAILSAIIPGAGQIYNGKYWKAPIVWAGMGAVGYYFLKNQTLYSSFRDSLRTSVADTGSSSSTIDYYQRNKVFYRKRRDIFGFGIIAVYLIQIIDANVDAHLKTFDVSDDLSLHIHAKPVITGTGFGAGLSLRLTFK